MSVEIITVGSEKRASLLQDSIGRVLAVGTDWTQLSLFARLQVEDFGSAPGVPTPVFQMGVMVTPTALMANSPRGSNCPHFVGMDSGTSAWTRTLHPTSPVPNAPYYSLAANRIKKVGATRTNAGGNAALLSCSGIKECMGVQITKGSPWTVATLYPTILEDVDATPDQILNVAEQPTHFNMASLLHIIISQNPAYWSYSNTITVDEATDGYLTSAVFTWNRDDFAMRLCDFFVLKTA